MTIRARLTLAFAGLGLILLLQVLVSYYANARNVANLRGIVDAHEISNAMTGLALEGQKMRRFEKEYFIYVDDVDKRSKYSADFFASHDRLKNEFIRLTSRESATWSAEDVERVGAWDDALNAYARGFTRLDLEVNGGAITDTLTANAAIQEAKNRFKPFLDGAEEQVAVKYQRAQDIAAMARQEQRRLQLFLYGLTIVGVLAAISMLVYIPLAISKPLTELTRAANEMSKGKIRDDIPVEGPPEIRDLAASMERMRVALRGIVERLQASRPTAAVTPISPGSTTTSRSQ